MHTSPCTANNSETRLNMGDPKLLDAMFGILAKNVPRQVATTCKDGREMMKGVETTPPSSPRNIQLVSVREQRRLAAEQYRALNSLPSDVIPIAL